MITLVTVRHARTSYNVAGRLQGSLDVPLGDEGLAQAERVAGAVVAEYGADLRVMTSPLQRASQTGVAIARHAGVQSTPDERVTQRPYGVWEGLTSDEVRVRWPEQYARKKAGFDPDIEGWGASPVVAARVADALTDWARAEADRAEPRTVVVVSHGSAIMLGLLQVLGLPLTPSRLGHLAHGEWNELHWHGADDWRLARYAVREHA